MMQGRLSRTDSGDEQNYSVSTVNDFLLTTKTSELTS